MVRADPPAPSTTTTRVLQGPVLWTAVVLVVSGVTTTLITLATPDPAGLRASLTTTVGATVTRAASDVAGVACVGIALAGLLVSAADLPPSAVRPGERALDRGDRLLVGLAAAWIALVLVTVLFRAAHGFGRDVTQVGVDQVVAWVTEIGAGRGAALTAVCALGVLVTAVLRLVAPAKVPLQLPLIAALMGVLTPTITGHAGSASGHSQAVVSSAVHAAAAAAWVGGLVAVLLLTGAHRSLAEAVLPLFSRLAAACVLALAATGVWSAVVRTEGWGPLFTSQYGAIVLVKAGVFLVVAALGGLTRRRLHGGRRPVLRWAGYEIALMAVALGLAAALAQTSPAQ